MYVIVDWHEVYLYRFTPNSFPNSKQEQAVSHQSKASEFFNTISAKYGKYPNILYELYNEPNGMCMSLFGKIR